MYLKRWVADFSDFNGGRFKRFFLKRSAVKYANDHKYETPWVTVENWNTKKQLI